MKVIILQESLSGLRSYYVKTQVLVWSLKLSNSDLSQYLLGWELPNTACYEFRFPDSVMVNELELEIGKPSSISSRIFLYSFIHKYSCKIYESTSKYRLLFQNIICLYNTCKWSITRWRQLNQWIDQSKLNALLFNAWDTSLHYYFTHNYI